MTNATVQVLAAGACLVLVVVFLVAQHHGRRNPPGPDVGVDIVDCGMVADVPTEPCPGPLVWFDVDSVPRGAIVECNACGYVLTTGNFHDQAHQETPLLRGAA